MMKITTISSLIVSGFVLVACSGKQGKATVSKADSTSNTNIEIKSQEHCVQPDMNGVRGTKDTTAKEVDVKGPSNIKVGKTLPHNMEVPEEMVFIPSGTTVFGNNHGLGRERPQSTIDVNGFFIDKHEVTVRQFRKFVKATGYVTEAEKFGNSGVFDLQQRKWLLVDGANWRNPLGPAAEKAKDNHPVTQVSWNDAVAYCNWAGKRLPTEKEWEYAAKCAGTVTSRYTWGDSVYWKGKFMANTYNGVFPYGNSGADGYLYTAPVGAFGEDPMGVQDMLGNVWEWCADKYLPYDPSNNIERIPLNNKERVQKGGSFMCDHQYCHGFRTTSRSGTSPETGLFHVGFRCVKDVYEKK